MNTQLPGNLGEIFPLRFRLREELRFFQVGDLVVSEKVRSGKRYSLKRWQYEMLLRFNGKKTFEEIAKLVYSASPGVFTANGLLNFYNWLYTENLVLCECDSIFELVLGDPDDGFESEAEGEDRIEFSEFASRLLKDVRVRRTLAISAAVVFCLSLIRIVYVAAPVFEPPVNRIYAKLDELIQDDARSLTLAESERSAETSSVEKVALASRILPEPVDEIPPPPPLALPDAETVLEEKAPGIDPVVKPGQMDTAPVAAFQEQRSRIESLRIELEECRIRRDEFYLQDDEAGYRREVHRMTNLAKEIGDIENAL